MAYAAVISLKDTIGRLNIRSDHRTLSILHCHLRGLDDRRPIKIDRSSINALEEKIIEAAYKYEDAIEFYALNHSRPRIAEYDSTRLEQESKSFFTTVKELVEDYFIVLNTLLPPDEEEEEEEEEEDDAEDFGGNESEAVGLSDHVEKLVNWLVILPPIELNTTWIVGMAGIGKTRLAREIYHHPLVNQHYKYKMWVRIGQHPDEERVLEYVVDQIERQRQARNSCDNLFAADERCLIVLDDVWSEEVIDYLEAWLPRGVQWQFIVTTRLREVATYSTARVHRMPFLDEEQSWSLLRQIVFAPDVTSISSQLEEAGRRIAEACEGLPLLILTVANILRVQDISEEYWKKVADKKTTTFPDAFEQIYHVLILSYDYLPQYLKACFLYMGVFPQSSVIPCTKLQILWVVEAFSEYGTCPHFEWLSKLVSDSLVIVCKRSSRDKIIKSCKLHSVYWYLCVKEARKVKLFHALTKLADVFIESRPRRLSFQNNVLLGIKEVYDSMAANTPSTTRSLLCTGEYHQYPVRICFNMILLKVLDALSIRLYEFPSEIVDLVELRYLALTHDGLVPSSISNLQKMQYLFLRQHHNIVLLGHSTYMPEEIWDVSELLHLQIMGCIILPDPPKESNGLYQLQTLDVNADSCTKNVYKGFSSHLWKLRITIELEPAGTSSSCFEHIGHLLKLKSLKCVVVNPRLISQVSSATPADHLSNLPARLLKLSLNGLGYSWKDISVIGLLPHLSVLKLRCNAFQGPEWESRPEEFKSLDVLVLEDMDLVHWTVKDGTFPHLDCLILMHCYKLKEIPKNIRNLETLEVVDCSPSLVASAEQRTSSDLELKITSSWNFH